VKKAIDVCQSRIEKLFCILLTLFQLHEQELAQDLAVKRLEVEKAEKARISNAVSDMEVIRRLEFETSF